MNQAVWLEAKADEAYDNSWGEETPYRSLMLAREHVLGQVRHCWKDPDFNVRSYLERAANYARYEEQAARDLLKEFNEWEAKNAK